MSNDLASAVHLAMGNHDACAAVRDVYTRLQIEIDRRKPVCVASGKCCNFEAYGHRLYVTTLELAAFTADLSPSPGTPGQRRPVVSKVERVEGVFERRQLSAIPNHPHTDPRSKILPVYRERGLECRFQIDNLCSVHPIRPFGCRIFFCDPTATQWQQDQYERFHAELKQLHERFSIPYFYVEWRQALESILP